MSALPYIVDEKLPISQDFKSLKREGLAYVQEYSGEEWTNLNASDPGVTILDQVCFALTELGYCGDFPVKDILTERDGKLHFEDQFYLPEDILTTSPVTSQDYIKYLVDGVSNVENAVIIPVADSVSTNINAYQVYLLISPAVLEEVSNQDKPGKVNKITKICRAAFFYLNASRNLGEIFCMPLPLQQVPYSITGTMVIENETALNTILTGISNSIRNYIFPAVIQSGYQQLQQSGFDVNDIFNGPLLQNGWIPEEHLGQKKDQLNITELTSLIIAVPGVQAVSNLGFANAGGTVTSLPNELLVIDLGKSIEQGLIILCQGRQITAAYLKQAMATVKPNPAEHNIQLGSSLAIQTEVPKGRYRDIGSYYSIQNTFPGLFAVGADAVTSNAPDYQVARSRQLKGYLTLFDQVLANQFSQLANIGRLFSFKNTHTGTPSDDEEYYAVKDSYEKDHPEYPVPYLTFSPTYFYQSLYDVPHIRPLLKDRGIFKFSIPVESQKELDHKSWTDYKLDPYNPYIRGLMEFIEEERNGLERRNAILDHLLARHGESPLMIDTIINGSIYSGDSLRDQVIFKSLYLQNLGLLSYYRQKAYSHFSANKIQHAVKGVPANLEHGIPGGYEKDFIFNSEKIDREEKLRDQDFVNYSAFELKLCMLFGLKVQYRNFLPDNYHRSGSRKRVRNAKRMIRERKRRLAYWMMSERKGSILVETNLLLECVDFEIILSKGTQTEQQLQIAENLNYEQVTTIARSFMANAGNGLNEELGNGTFSIADSNYTLTSTQNAGQQYKWFKLIPGTDYYFTTRIKDGNEVPNFGNTPVFNSTLKLILPEFIPQIHTKAFKTRLNLFVQYALPVQASCNIHFVKAGYLKKLIPAFAKWHNAFRYDDRRPVNDKQFYYPALRHRAGVLTDLLIHINPPEND